MATIRDWQRNRDMWVRVLKSQTGEDVEAWNERIRRRSFQNEHALRVWLAKQHVTGYAQSLLVMERFGYPHFVIATADQLIDAQYADREHLRAIYDAIIGAAAKCGEMVIQARKTYVSLLTFRRTFARVQPYKNACVNLGLRLEGQRPGGRLQPSRIHETMPLQITLAASREVDAEVCRWLCKAYLDNS